MPESPWIIICFFSHNISKSIHNAVTFKFQVSKYLLSVHFPDTIITIVWHQYPQVLHLQIQPTAEHILCFRSMVASHGSGSQLRDLDVHKFYIHTVGRTTEKAMAPHSSTLAWKIPWMEEPGGLQSMGSLGVGHFEQLHFHFSLSCIGEGNGNPLQCACQENPRDGVAQSQTWLKQLSSSSSREEQEPPPLPSCPTPYTKGWLCCAGSIEQDRWQFLPSWILEVKNHTKWELDIFREFAKRKITASIEK